jgi:hypothetical protein
MYHDPSKKRTQNSSVHVKESSYTSTNDPMGSMVTFLWVTITFFLFHVGPPLWRQDESVICSAMKQFHVILRSKVSRLVRLGARPYQSLIFFVWQFISSSCRALPPISPLNTVVQPKDKVKSQSYVSVGRNFSMLPLGGLNAKHTVQRGIWVPTQHLFWDQRKPRKSLIELAGRSTFRMQTDF